MKSKRQWRISHQRIRAGQLTTKVRTFAMAYAAQAYVDRLKRLHGPSPLGLTVQHREVPAWSDGWGDQPEEQAS